MSSSTDLQTNDESLIEITENEIHLEIAALQLLWRRYGYLPILRKCAERALHEQRTQEKQEYIRWMPWVNQRLAQCALADPQCPSLGLKQLDLANFDVLLRRTHDFVQSTAPVAQLKSQNLSAIRAIAFQQFDFQTASQFAIVRQFHIFNHLPENHRLRRSTIENDVDYDDLTVGSFLIAGFMMSNPGKPISASNMASQYLWFPKKKLIAMLRSLSSDVEHLRARFSAQSDQQISILSALHSSAFASTPFVEIARRQHVPWHQG